MKKILYLLFTLLIAAPAYASLTIAVDYFSADTNLNSTPPAPVLLLPLGDSKTVGAGDNEQQTGFAYRDHLQTLLGIGSYNFVGPYKNPSSSSTFDVDHAGVSGNTSAQELARLPSLLNTYMTGAISNSSIAIVDAGTNDCNLGISNATTVNNIRTIMTTINAFNSHITIYVVLPNPTHDAGLTSCINTLNGLIKTNVLAYQVTKSNVHVYDEYAEFVANADWEDDYLSDVGLSHPNDTGYALEAQGLYNCMVDPSDTYCDGN